MAEGDGRPRADLSRQDHKADTTRAGLETKIDTTRADLENKIDATRAYLENKIEATRVELENKIDVGFATLKEMIAGVRLSTQVDLERMKAELVRWVFATIVGNVAIAAATALVVDVLRHR